MIWKKNKNRITVTSEEGIFYFNMPEYFKLNEVHPDLFRLAELVLFNPWYKDLKQHKFTRTKGKKIGLAFSGGADSMAAQCLLPKDDTILFYHKRVGNLGTLATQDNPLYVFDINKLDVNIFESNHEQIRTHHGKNIGFSTDLALAAAGILMADYWNLGYIATGTMLESTFLYRGYKYRDFSQVEFWRFWFNTFQQAGLELFWPVMPCSEFLTQKILTANGRTSISCLRGRQEPCGKCYKCFRKLSIAGIQPKLHPESSKVLNGRPLKQAASLIYAMNKYNLNIPPLAEYKGMNLSWLENYYKPAIDMIPVEYRDYLTAELDKYTTPITGNEIEKFNIEGVPVVK